MTSRLLRAARTLLWAGLLLTVAVAAWPMLAPGVLADHVQAGYPGYTAAEVQTAVTAWQILLTALAGTAVLGWLWTLWSVRGPRSWAHLSATAVLALAVLLTLTLALTPDTSGEVGLAPALGAAWFLPCAVGAAATLTLWRARTVRAEASRRTAPERT